jgi:hypothetical protein
VKERALFNDLINATDAEHFRQSDLPLLINFVQSTLLARRAAAGMERDSDLIAVFEKAIKLQGMLATRLRIAPQSRLDPKTVARHQLYDGPPPWDWEPKK